MSLKTICKIASHQQPMLSWLRNFSLFQSADILH